MFLSAAQNVNNLATALAGKGINIATKSPIGSMYAYGVMAMQEQGGFLEQSDVLVDAGMPPELAEKYSLEYGAISGAIEYSEQALNIATLGGAGKTMELLGVKVWREVCPREVCSMGRREGRLDATGEGLEELAQEALQYHIMSKMLGEWAEKSGKKGFSGELDNVALPINPKTGEVDWDAAKGDLWKAFKMGAGGFYRIRSHKRTEGRSERRTEHPCR